MMYMSTVSIGKCSRTK